MIPASTLLQIPGFGRSTLLIGAVVFALVLAAVIGVIVWYSWDSSDPWDAFAEACHEIVDSENADAIAFVPYSDGPMLPKPAIYDRELMGGKGGYRTPDGDRIYVDGEGNGKFTLEGVDVVLAIDPTEHAAAADPLKAWIQHQADTGSWIKVDQQGTVIEAADALTSVDGMTPAIDQPRTATTDGGEPVSEVHKHARETGMNLEKAAEALEADGHLRKIVDIAPPSETVIDEETGEVSVEEASHVGVDISAAADLLPKKTNTTALQVLEEKARQEGMDEEKLMSYFMYGMASGGVTAAVSAVLIALVLGFT